MELLRIIAMFLILVVHSDYFSLGAPTREDIIASPLASVTRVGIESVSLICVNLFIFISGWFGITLKRHKIADLLFQIAYFYFGLFFIALIAGYASINLHSIRLLLLLTKHNWFIPAYLLLCILSPVLNSFIDNTDRKRFLTVLVGFFAVQTWCGWLAESDTFRGYSTISFTGIYLLARYISKYNLADYISKERAIIVFVGCTTINTIIGLVTTYTGKLTALYMPYINPLTTIATVSFALIFVKLSFKSNIINFIAKSVFAVFLLHSNFNLVDRFTGLNIYIFNNYSGVIVLAMIFIACCAWFAAAVVIDQPRIWLWRRIQTYRWTRNILKIQSA